MSSTQLSLLPEVSPFWTQLFPAIRRQTRLVNCCLCVVFWWLCLISLSNSNIFHLLQHGMWFVLWNFMVGFQSLVSVLVLPSISSNGSFGSFHSSQDIFQKMIITGQSGVVHVSDGKKLGSITFPIATSSLFVGDATRQGATSKRTSRALVAKGFFLAFLTQRH